MASISLVTGLGAALGQLYCGWVNLCHSYRRMHRRLVHLHTPLQSRRRLLHVRRLSSRFAVVNAVGTTPPCSRLRMLSSLLLLSVPSPSPPLLSPPCSPSCHAAGAVVTSSPSLLFLSPPSPPLARLRHRLPRHHLCRRCRHPVVAITASTGAADVVGASAVSAARLRLPCQ